MLAISYTRTTSPAANRAGTLLQALEIEATKEAGPNDNAFGVMVREISSSDYYAYLISSDGYYQVAKLENNSWAYVSDWVNRVQ